MTQPTGHTAPATSPLALLPLPPYGSVSAQQARGITCVWDGVALTADTAIDFQPRQVPGRDELWFPRGCRPCTIRAAMHALTEHSQVCDQCTRDHTACPTGLGLVRAVRETRR